MKQNNELKLIQFLDTSDDLNFNFYFKGNTIHSQVFNSTQYPYKKHMAPPKRIDFAKSVISPMPGSIVSVGV